MCRQGAHTAAGNSPRLHLPSPLATPPHCLKMPDPQPSQYRKGSWTVTRLKDELTKKSLSPVGNKQALIERLEHSASHHKEEAASLASGRQSGPESPSKGGRSRSRARAPIATGKEWVKDAYEAPTDAIVRESNAQLREALSECGAATTGGRAVLIARLREARASSAKKDGQGVEEEERAAPVLGARHLCEDDIGLLRSPLWTLRLFLRFVVAECTRERLQGAARILCLLVLLPATVVALCAYGGRHMAAVAPASLRSIVGAALDAASWYGQWVVLGVFSAIGIGNGPHTFQRFLAPFIGRVAAAARLCGTLNFATWGRSSLLCPTSDSASGQPASDAPGISILMLFGKIKWVAFTWGVGTAIGELIPFASGSLRKCLFRALARPPALLHASSRLCEPC